MIRTNLDSVFEAGVRGHDGTGWGRIINVSSIINICCAKERIRQSAELGECETERGEGDIDLEPQCSAHRPSETTGEQLISASGAGF